MRLVPLIIIIKRCSGHILINHIEFVITSVGDILGCQNTQESHQLSPAMLQKQVPLQSFGRCEYLQGCVMYGISSCVLGDKTVSSLLFPCR